MKKQFYDKIMNDSESRHTEQSKYALKNQTRNKN